MKPSNFNILRNIKNSLSGIQDIFENEMAFRIELLTFILFSLIALNLNITIVSKIILIASMPIVLIAEVINSAIERAVDTATMDYDENAKKAKDAASAIVLLSILWVVIIWSCTLFLNY
jgi:diacylglycerol kinase (ATP)